ncbi:hypothetical protein ONE63_000397 [Megalurothrips usitatus]|uniref:Uncharacterized protein n=1 Tax=Megalurothrips usitatus TaxID=439358 RepID=A0AAV7XYB5_9NEOP|nr:hypothetical protein ONE63_000397 [Megalurothrips usitatus]
MLGDRNFSNEKLEIESEQQGGSQQFQIRPHLSEKFRPQEVKEIILNILTENLSGKVYASEEVGSLTKDLACQVRSTVKDMPFPRYKFMVQVVLGEQRAAGVKMGARCMWDSDADSYASAEYQNDSLFCVATVFAVFTY